MTQKLERSNKITARFNADGIAEGAFYRTHKKIMAVNSDDEKLVALGFVFPESIPGDAEKGIAAVEVSATEKLTAFKNFLVEKSHEFGITYDPIDRRTEDNKFPSAYTAEIMVATSMHLLEEALNVLVDKIQKPIDKLVENKHMDQVHCLYEIADMDADQVAVQECYKSGNLKYAQLEIPVEFNIGVTSKKTSVVMELVSGQLKKPRYFEGDRPMTMTSLKTMFEDCGMLPKIEKVKEVTPVGDAPETETTEAIQE